MLVRDIEKSLSRGLKIVRYNIQDIGTDADRAHRLAVLQRYEGKVTISDVTYRITPVSSQRLHRLCIAFSVLMYSNMTVDEINAVEKFRSAVNDLDLEDDLDQFLTAYNFRKEETGDESSNNG